MSEATEELKDTQLKLVTFLQRVSEGQYAEIEESSIAYSRLNAITEDQVVLLDEYLYSIC